MNQMRKTVVGSTLVRSDIVWAHTDRKGRYQKVIRVHLEGKGKLESLFLNMLLKLAMVKLKPELVMATGAGTLASEASWPEVSFTLAILFRLTSFTK